MAKTILITGATDGIGRATALELARRGARVLVHGRNPDKVDEVVAAIGKQSPEAPQARGLVADLASRGQVRALAAEVAGEAPSLDVLLNNAGVFLKERSLTPDGFEVTFMVNHLAHFLLTNLLLDALRAAPAARVVTVSSIAHTRGRMYWDDLHLEKHWDAQDTGMPLPGYVAYAQSKLANVLFANALARRVQDHGITSNSLHPGVITTKLLRTGFGMGGASVDEGAATSVHVAVADEVEGVTGRYFASCKETPAADAALDEQAQERLWQVSAEMTGLA